MPKVTARTGDEEKVHVAETKKKRLGQGRFDPAKT